MAGPRGAAVDALHESVSFGAENYDVRISRVHRKGPEGLVPILSGGPGWPGHFCGPFPMALPQSTGLEGGVESSELLPHPPICVAHRKTLNRIVRIIAGIHGLYPTNGTISTPVERLASDRWKSALECPTLTWCASS